MKTTQLHPTRQPRNDSCASASCLAMFRRRPRPLGYRAFAPTGRAQVRSGRFAAVLLAAMVMLGALWLGQPGVASAADLSLSDLGDRVCAPQGAECRELWNTRMAAGDTFRSLVAAVCLHLRYKVHELDGIVCLETVINAARSLPTSLLANGTTASVVTLRDGSRPPRPDQQWRDAVVSHFENIPAYCDETTPVVFDYFDCVLRELQTVEFALRHRSL